jgi:hypothetical protein
MHGLQEETRWWRRRGLNPRPPRCERGALPAELLPHPVNGYFPRSGRLCQSKTGKRDRGRRAPPADRESSESLFAQVFRRVSDKHPVDTRGTLAPASCLAGRTDRTALAARGAAVGTLTFAELAITISFVNGRPAGCRRPLDAIRDLQAVGPTVSRRDERFDKRDFSPALAGEIVAGAYVRIESRRSRNADAEAAWSRGTGTSNVASPPEARRSDSVLQGSSRESAGRRFQGIANLPSVVSTHRVHIKKVKANRHFGVDSRNEDF